MMPSAELSFQDLQGQLAGKAVVCACCKKHLCTYRHSRNTTNNTTLRTASPCQPSKCHSGQVKGRLPSYDTEPSGAPFLLCLTLSCPDTSLERLG
jgi:hypothetical protein